MFNDERNRFRIIFAILAVFVLVIVIIFDKSSTTYAGSPPTVDSVIITTTTPNGIHADEINLSEGTTRSVYIHGEITDSDGCSDLNNNTLQSVFYRSSVSGGSGCSENFNNCYRVSYSDSECIITGCDIGTEETVGYECAVSVAYYADPTDSGGYPSDTWVGWVYVEDSTSESDSSFNTTEINSLAALDISSVMSYGQVNLGATSTEDTVLSIVNRGNVAIDVYLSGQNISCSKTGYVSVEKQRYSLSSGQSYDDMTVLTYSSELAQLNLAKQITMAPSMGFIYYKIAIPSTGVGGSCGGANSVVAVIDS